MNLEENTQKTVLLENIEYAQMYRSYDIRKWN